METLRGVFPRPKVPPKRDFLKENIIKIKEKSKTVSSEKQLKVIHSPRSNLALPRKSKKTQQLKPDKSNRYRSASRDSLSTPCTQSVCCSHDCRPGSRISQLVDSSCQTVDVDSEIFLKDAIIRYPTSFTDNYNNNNAKNTEISHYREENANIACSGDGDCRRKSYIANLNEFLDTGSITKKSSCNSSNCPDRRSPSPTTIRNIKTPNSPTLRKFCDENNDNAATSTPSSHRKQKPQQPPQTANSIDYNQVDNETLKSRILSNEFLIQPPKTASSNNSANSPVNTRSVISKIDSIASNTTQSKSELPSNYKKGEIPKYLQERKESIIRQKELEKEIDPDCPKGHIVLSEEDRQESLSLAKERFQDLVNELNKLPMTAETLKIRRRKIDIEKELDSLEAKIRIFSRNKVYVKIEE